MRVSLIIAALAALLCGCTSREEPVSGDMRAHELSLAVAPDAAYVAWHGGLGEDSSIHIQQIDGDGRPVGQSFAVSDGSRLAYEPDLILAPDRLVVAWYERDSAGDLSAWLAGVSRQGQREWLVRLDAGGDQARNPVVRWVGNGLGVAWIEQPATDDGSNRAEIWMQRISMSGTAVAQPRQVGEANRDTWNLNAAATGGTFMVAYDAAIATKAHELHLLTVNGEGVRDAVVSEDDGRASVYPDLQVNGSGQAALTWFDERDGNQEVYLAVMPFDRFGSEVIPPAIRVSHSAEDSIGAYVAWNGDAIGLAWSDELSGERDILAQTFSADGKPLGRIRRLGAGEDDAGVPTIHASGTGFLVGWNDYVIEGGGSHMSIASSVARLATLPVGD